MGVTNRDPETTSDSKEAIAETIKNLHETDLIVINGDTRTYHVTDVVEQVGDDGDAFTNRYVIRLEWHRGDGRLALVLEERTKAKIEVHVLQDDRLPGEGGTYDVEAVEIIPTNLEWVIHYRGRNHYHRPDPEAAARGQAEPFCGMGAEGIEPKFRRRGNLHPGQEACAHCFRDFWTG